MNRIVNKINVEYKLLINNSLEYTNYYTNYTYEQYSGFINITKLVLNINTTSRKNILNTNITILSIALLIRGLDISINYNESNQQYILNVEIRNLILNYSILEDEFVKKLLKIPGDLGTDLFFEQNILFVKANSWCENNYLNLERSILGLNTAYFIINNTYVLPIKLLGNYSQYVIIGFADRVGIDSINWRLVFENKFVKANIVVNGYGFGTNIEEKILSSIRNIHELSKIYGCVKVSTSGFKIIYDDNMYESIDICSNMDLNKINIHIDSGRKRLFEINWVILITITILLAILLLIITLYFSTRRVR